MADTTNKKNGANNSKKETTAKKRRADSIQGVTTSTLPSAEDLKARFKAGSVPTEADFNDLIALANSGAQVAGQTPEQTGPGAGMRISETGQLEPNLDAHDFTDDPDGYSPVMINSAPDKNNIVVDLYNGLTHTEKHGLTVKPGTGIAVDDNGVNVVPGNGIAVDGDGITIKYDPDSGLEINKSGLAIKSYPDNALKTDKDGLWVQVNWIQGMAVDHNGLRVSLAPQGGLSFNNKGEIYITNPLGYQLPLSSGVITGFHGSEIPEGWALCNGENNTPDLRTMFVSNKKDTTKNSDNENPEEFQLVYIMKK